jgi:uncharacterized protein (DUF1330 family)
MAAYVAVQVEVLDKEKYETYKQLAPPSIAQYGGRYIVRGAPCETLEGSWSPERFVILEFPTVERARQWWNSSEYANAKALRNATARTEMIVVQGL